MRGVFRITEYSIGLQTCQALSDVGTAVTLAITHIGDPQLSFCISGALIAPPGQEGCREATGWWFKEIFW